MRRSLGDDDAPPHEFIRRFLMHLLPNGFHRVRDYRLFAIGKRVDNIARARELLNAAPPVKETRNAESPVISESVRAFYVAPASLTIRRSMSLIIARMMKATWLRVRFS